MKLSAAEYEIMECVWALGRTVSGMDIMRALGQEKGWKQPTVLTFLSRLVEKGLLETEKRGKLRSYTAAMTREAYKNSETRDEHGNDHCNHYSLSGRNQCRGCAGRYDLRTGGHRYV